MLLAPWMGLALGPNPGPSDKPGTALQCLLLPPGPHIQPCTGELFPVSTLTWSVPALSPPVAPSIRTPQVPSQAGHENEKCTAGGDGGASGLTRPLLAWPSASACRAHMGSTSIRGSGSSAWKRLLFMARTDLCPGSGGALPLTLSGLPCPALDDHDPNRTELQ